MTPEVDGIERRPRRRCRCAAGGIMSKMISGGGAAAVLAAAAWSLPYRACQALRLTHFPTPTRHRANRMLRMAGFEARLQQRQITAGFALYTSSSGSSRGFRVNRLSLGAGIGANGGAGGHGRCGSVRLSVRRPGPAGVLRMVSDEGQFFADPDAPPPTLDGVGPPGPLVSGSEGNDKVSPCLKCLGSCRPCHVCVNVYSSLCYLRERTVYGSGRGASSVRCTAHDIHRAAHAICVRI